MVVGDERSLWHEPSDRGYGWDCVEHGVEWASLLSSKTKNSGAVNR